MSLRQCASSELNLPTQLLVNGQRVTRSYSRVGTPDSAGYRIAVKRLVSGRGLTSHVAPRRR